MHSKFIALVLMSLIKLKKETTVFTNKIKNKNYFRIVLNDKTIFILIP